MATKLNDELKAIDNYARNLNNQISKAYKNLGADSKVYKNLVSHAKIYFGTSNIRTNNNGIMQISRAKSTLESYSKNNAVQSSKKEYYHKQSKTGNVISKKFDVTGAYQSAIKQIKQHKQKTGDKSGVTKSEISKQIKLNDKHNSIFALYESWRDKQTFGYDEKQYTDWNKILEQARKKDVTSDDIDNLYDLANKYSLSDNSKSGDDMEKLFMSGKNDVF